ncbi:MAG: peptidoglycan DD-metalloendopeptidase family protein [Saprospiraceae bacterium]|nr:peptidoglycan DD-metalloendopeptidase family protein [Saprospiraceae bacterium]
MKYQVDIQDWINTICLVAILLVVGFGSAQAQNRQELESKRKQLLREIEETTTRLSQTRKDKAAALDRYFTLKKQIKNRQQLIITLRAELDFAEASIQRANEVVDALEQDVVDLKQEYANTLRSAYRSSINKSSLAFLFAAEDFNDLFLRWQYIRQYNEYRQRQARLIIETQEMLIGKAEQLAERKIEKEQLLISQEEQQIILNKELADKDQLLSKLKVSESKLAANLEDQQEAHAALNATIERIIREEMAEQRRASRNASSLTASTEKEEAVKNVATDRRLSVSFENLKGALPWPVKSGKIIKKYGRQPHPNIQTIQITNNGIDIESEARARVFAIYDGKVVGLRYIPGYQNTVILQHGTYYSVYSNLEEVFVGRGDEVNADQALGRLSKDKPEVHFEVWKEKQRMNPTLWVKPL